MINELSVHISCLQYIYKLAGQALFKHIGSEDEIEF